MVDPTRMLDPATLDASVDEGLASAKRQRDRLVGGEGGTDAGAVAEAYDRIFRPIDAARGWSGLFAQTHPSSDVQDAARAAEQKIASFLTDLSLDRDVYERLAAVDLERARTPAERRLLERTLRDFKKSGVDRDQATRERIRAIADELVVLGQEFELEIVRDVRKVELEGGAAALDGLPDDFVASHTPDARGSIVVTTDPQDYLPMMTYARNAGHRRSLYRESATRAYPANVARLQRMLALRHELATACGYASYAEYMLDDKMVAGAKGAGEFVERVATLARPRALAEYDELLALKREDEPGATQIDDWDRFHYFERGKQAHHGFDSRLVRPYFAYSNVRDGVLATSQALFGLDFRRDRDAPTWHPSVECYDVLRGTERIARFYLDMHPRAGKYKHAAMFPLESGVAGEALPQAALVCNFPEPRDADPALLQHQQVTTFFHEFGHLLHHLLGGEQRFLAFSGIATELDFVEVPSQLYEEWAWDSGVLQRFALHHQTGEPIPRDLIERLRAGEEYGKGLHVLTQMFYAALALAYHDRDPRGLDLAEEMVGLKRRLTPFPYEPGTHFYASFGHLNGYGAGYYGYMWALVIAKDFLASFHGDLMSRATAERYQRAVLAPGGSRDGRDLVRDFLGREVELEAWRRWLEA